MKAQRETIESIGFRIEKGGFSPMSARVFTYLLLVPNDEATFEELVNYFNASKSAISNALKFLILKDIVIEKRKSENRKRYFSVDFGRFMSLDKVLEHHKQTKGIIEDILKERQVKTKTDEDLKIIVNFFNVIERTLPAIHKKYFDKKQ